MAAGQQLPATRELASEYKLSRNTVIAILTIRQLGASGIDTAVL